LSFFIVFLDLLEGGLETVEQVNGHQGVELVHSEADAPADE